MIASLFAAAALIGAGDPDGVITTAPQGARSITAETALPSAGDSPAAAVQQAAHGLSTAQQIDRWLAPRTEGVAPYGAAAAEPLAEERRMHGQVSAAIGTHGYRAYGAAVDLPLGETGWLSLSVSQRQGGYGYGPDGYGYGRDGYGWGGYPYGGLSTPYGGPGERPGSETRAPVLIPEPR